MTEQAIEPPVYCNGVIPGTDGRDATATYCSPADDCCCHSPILIDLAGDGFALTDWRHGVKFALKPKQRSISAWTLRGSDDAWLVLDRNGNGLIDDGSEVFGNFTEQAVVAGKPRNGFAALALLDQNNDGIVDIKDSGFYDLRLWQDRNHDGISDTSELLPLLADGVAGISVIYDEQSRSDANGNNFRYSSVVIGTSGSRVGMTAYDVLLVHAVIPATTSDTIESEGTVTGGIGKPTDESQSRENTSSFILPNDYSVWYCPCTCNVQKENADSQCPLTVDARGSGSTEDAAYSKCVANAKAAVPYDCIVYNCRKNGDCYKEALTCN